MIDRKPGAGFGEDSARFERAANAGPTMTATDAKNRFGELLDMARKEPVFVQKNGRTVAVMISPEDYRRLVEGSAVPKVRPLVEELLEKSIERRRSLYEALAK
jgi:prevent-host-death family protein